MSPLECRGCRGFGWNKGCWCTDHLRCDHFSRGQRPCCGFNVSRWAVEDVPLYLHQAVWLLFMLAYASFISILYRLYFVFCIIFVIFMILYDLHREAKRECKERCRISKHDFSSTIIACWWGWTAWTFASRSKPDDRPGILCASDLDMSSIWIDMESGVMQRFSDVLTICLHNF